MGLNTFCKGSPHYTSSPTPSTARPHRPPHQTKKKKKKKKKKRQTRNSWTRLTILGGEYIHASTVERQLTSFAPACLGQDQARPGCCVAEELKHHEAEKVVVTKTRLRTVSLVSAFDFCSCAVNTDRLKSLPLTTALLAAGELWVGTHRACIGPNAGTGLLR